MEWLKILIFNYSSVKLSVKRPNKKPRIPNFTTDPSPFFFFFFFFFPICKKHQNSFLSLLSSPQPLLFFSMLRYVFFSFLLFYSQFFLISILYDFFFLLSFTCNYIKVIFFLFSSFFMFFSLYLFFILFLIFFLNNCMNVVVGFFFIWDQFLVDLFIGFLNFFHILNNYRWNYIWYFAEGNTNEISRKFFLHAFFVKKSIGNNIFFITNGQKLTDKRFTDRACPSVILLVN